MTEVKRKRRRAAPAGIAPSEPERDILDQYLYEVSTYPLLKAAEEIDLAKKIRAGDQDAHGPGFPSVPVARQSAQWRPTKTARAAASSGSSTRTTVSRSIG